MPRKARVEFAGAVYHLMDRGNQREAIFRDFNDRERLLTTLGQACERTGWRVHTFVFMMNHYRDCKTSSTVIRHKSETPIESGLPMPSECIPSLPAFWV